MGCGASKTADDLMELAPRPNAPPEPDLSPELLQQALGYMAQHIAKRRASITVIGVGGAVNVILLRTRLATHDVDFFNANLSQRDSVIIREATAFARKQMQKACRIDLPASWFNNQTTVFIKSSLRKTLTEEAIAQNEIVFRAQGLTILAAPWPYALCAKIHRISGGNPRQYDASDAANYLQRYLSRKRSREIRAQTIRQWGQKYEISIRDRDIAKVDDAYTQLYRSKVVRW